MFTRNLATTASWVLRPTRTSSALLMLSSVLQGLFNQLTTFFFRPFSVTPWSKYAKPFVQTETPFGRTRYPVRQLKAVRGFSSEIHTHLLELRNTLVAHDDLESIEPRILQFCVSITESAFSIPVSIAISNKCLAYPADLSSVHKLREHVAACVQGVLDNLNSDLRKFETPRYNIPNRLVKASATRRTMANPE